jgi:hypothetical protein
MGCSAVGNQNLGQERGKSITAKARDPEQRNAQSGKRQPPRPFSNIFGYETTTSESTATSSANLSPRSTLGCRPILRYNMCKLSPEPGSTAWNVVAYALTVKQVSIIYPSSLLHSDRTIGESLIRQCLGHPAPLCSPLVASLSLCLSFRLLFLLLPRLSAVLSSLWYTSFFLWLPLQLLIPGLLSL